MKDYYKILGIDQSATKEEIRSAYKKLAFKYHPDRNLHDRKYAEDKFKEITEAYGVLMDSQKRQEYDRTRNLKDSRQRSFTGQNGFYYYQENIFRDMFNDEYANKIFKDLEKEFAKYGMQFDPHFFENLFFGKKGFFFGGVFFFGPHKSKKRYYSYNNILRENNPTNLNYNFQDVLKYRKAKSESFWEKLGRKIKHLALDKKSCSQPEQRGEDLYYCLKISPEEALSGTEVKIAFNRGGKQEKLKVKIPAGIKSGTTLRLKGKGIAEKDVSGNLYIKVDIRDT